MSEPGGDPAPACPACRSTGDHTAHEAREMMFGTREAFTYLECSACGTLWLRNPPPDLGPYYPAEYYAGEVEEHDPPGSWLRRALTRAAVRPILFARGERLGRLAGHLVAEPAELQPLRPLIPRYGIRSFSDRILDVGCGWTPARLCALRRLGFRHLLGVDPFVPRDLVHHGIVVQRRELEDVVDRFHVVMFHHSLEHVRDPRATLAAASRRLLPGGRILVRTPIAGSALWDRYGVDWWELDPPRHLVVLSIAGLRAAAASVGLEIAATFFDSSEREIIGSEQIRRDVGEFEPGSWFVDPARSAYSPVDVDRFAAEARGLNAEGRAGRGGFVLRAAV